MMIFVEFYGFWFALLQRRNFKKWLFKPKNEKSLHTPSHRLSLYQTCCTFMSLCYRFNKNDTLKIANLIFYIPNESFYFEICVIFSRVSSLTNCIYFLIILFIRLSDVLALEHTSRRQPTKIILKKKGSSIFS